MTATASRTPLSGLLARMNTGESASPALAIPPDWLQGRAVYGGLSAALCLQSVLDTTPGLAPLRSAQMAFIAPAGPDVSFTPAVVRQGRSATFATADMWRDDGGLAARGLFCFGPARDSQLAHAGEAAPDVADPEHCGAFFEDVAGADRGPNFAQHFDSRRAAGPLPMSQADTPEFTAWLRHRDRDIASVSVALAALADALPPAAMACFDAPAPVSSMTWQFDLIDAAPRTDDGWWLCRSRAEYIGQGYETQTMVIWNTDRQPVLIGRQNVAVFY